MKKILLVLVVAMFVFSCNTNNNSGNASKKDVKNEAKQEKSSNDNNGKIYSVESGYLKYKMMADNMEIFVTLYFKDYGNKTAMVSEMSMLGQKLKNHILLKDEYIYMFNTSKTEGIKMKYDKVTDDPFKSFSITEKTVEEKGGKKIGTEKLLGKECAVYEIPDSVNPKESAKAWVWKGLTVKIVDKDEVVIDAVELEETSNFPASTFEVPKDIKFTDVTDMKQPSDKANDSDFNEEGAVG